MLNQEYKKRVFKNIPTSYKSPSNKFYYWSKDLNGMSWGGLKDPYETMFQSWCMNFIKPMQPC